MRRKPLPAKPDPRPEWMVQQGNRCGCKGTDDMCPCQNEDQSQPQSRRDLAGEVRTLELQQQTDRQTIAGLLRARETAESRATAAEARVAELEGVLKELTAACEADFIGGTDMSDEPDDEAVGGGLDGDMAITFGMLRRARAALQTEGRADG